MVEDRYILDASTLIDIWMRFPIDLKVFNSLWDQIEELIESGNLVVTRRNFEEVKHKSEEAYDHFKSLGIQILTPTQQILEIAISIQEKLGLTDADIKNNLRDGVDEGDILCIATAKSIDVTLVTEEKRQPAYSGNKGPSYAKYKIPKVCEMQEISVKCINFLELLVIIKDL